MISETDANFRKKVVTNECRQSLSPPKQQVPGPPKAERLPKGEKKENRDFETFRILSTADGSSFQASRLMVDYEWMQIVL